MNINIVNDFICGSRVTQSVMKNNVFGCDENYISFVIIHEACSYHKLFNAYVYYALYIHLIICKIKFDECHD